MKLRLLIIPFPHDTDDGKCVVRIRSADIRTPQVSEMETWYHMWEAVVAVNAMCTRVGKRGLARGLGGFSLFPFHILSVYFWERRRRKQKGKKKKANQTHSSPLPTGDHLGMILEITDTPALELAGG